MDFSCKRSFQQNTFCCRKHIDDVVVVENITQHSSGNNNNIDMCNKKDDNHVDESIHLNSCISDADPKTRDGIHIKDESSKPLDTTNKVNTKFNGFISDDGLDDKCSNSNAINSEPQSTSLLKNTDSILKITNNKNKSVLNNNKNNEIDKSNNRLKDNNNAITNSETTSLLVNNDILTSSRIDHELMNSSDNINIINDVSNNFYISTDGGNNNNNTSHDVCNSRAVVFDESNNNCTNNTSSSIILMATVSSTSTTAQNNIVHIINNNNQSKNINTTNCKNKKSNFKKKSLTLFAKSSKLKDYILNKGHNKKQAVKGKGSGDDANDDKATSGINGDDDDDLKVKPCHDASLLVSNGVNDGSNHNNKMTNKDGSNNNEKLKSIFRMDKKKLSILHLPNNKNNKKINSIVDDKNNANTNEQNSNGSNNNNGNDIDDEQSGRSNSSSNSIVTPSPTTFHTTSNNNNTLCNNNVEDNNRPVSFDIRTRNLPEIPNDGLRGGIRSAEITQQQQLSLEQQQQQSSSSAAIVESDATDPFIESFNDLKNKGWYWGPLSWKEAEDQLKDKPIGSFLVRDSSDERYILSLSFKSEDQTHHTRIEHYRGQFSFNAQPRSHGAATIVEFIEKAIENCTDGSFSYFLRPKGPGLPPTMVRLTNPVSRLMKTHSLQHLCRFVVLSQIRRDLIESLPVPALIKTYLACNQYYVEGD